MYVSRTLLKGGNPLLSFYFIHRYGLTSWKKYPYNGHEGTCENDLVNRPVATVKSWGVLSPNHETHMELAIRYIGPISVGFNGADPSFLSYNGGIYHKSGCHQSANHALLIVGYGQEEHIEQRVIPNKKHGGNHIVNETVITKYWIARNSWGTGWGEGGYVRIRRGDGKKGTEGVCGIARSPSVALGGVLLKRLNHILPPIDAYHSKHNQVGNNNDNKNKANGMDTASLSYSNETDDYDVAKNASFIIDDDENNNTGSSDSSDGRLYIRDVNPDVKIYDPQPGPGHQICNTFGSTETTSWCHQTASWFESHTAFSICLIICIVNCMVIWPLTIDCRKRRARHLRKQQQLLQQQRSDGNLARLEQGGMQKQPDEAVNSSTIDEDTDIHTKSGLSDFQSGKLQHQDLFDEPKTEHSPFLNHDDRNGSNKLSSTSTYEVPSYDALSSNQHH